jgi:nitrite reductase (NADH) small subunit
VGVHDFRQYRDRCISKGIVSHWIKLCSREQLPAEGHAKEFTADGLTVCVATIDGKPHALNNVCPHRGGPLADGTIEGGKLVCPWHQWEFDLATGQATGSSRKKALVYALRQQGEDVMVEIG